MGRIFTREVVASIVAGFIVIGLVHLFNGKENNTK